MASLGTAIAAAEANIENDSQRNYSPITRIGILAATGFTATGVLAAVFQSLAWRMPTDVPLMHFIAVQMMRGAVPYRDNLDMNMPGTYWFHEAVIVVLGTGAAAWRAVDLGFLAIICAIGGWIVGRRSVPACIFAIAALAGWHLAAGPQDAGQRDYLIVALLMVGLASLLIFSESNVRRYLAISGLMVGLATLIKPTVICLPLFLLPVLLAPRWTDLRRNLGTFALPIAGVLVIAATALSLRGG